MPVYGTYDAHRNSGDDSPRPAGSVMAPGAYRALHEAERKRCARPSPRSFPPRPQLLLEAMEAGRPVRVPIWAFGGHSVPAQLPWERGTVRAVLITAEDVLTPVEETDFHETGDPTA